MIRIFTRGFLRMSPRNQSAILNFVISDLENSIGRHMNSEDDRKAEKQIERIRRKAVKYGVWSEATVDGSDRAKPNRRGDLPGQLQFWPE